MMDMMEMLHDLAARVAKLEAMMTPPPPELMPTEPEAPAAEVAPQEDMGND